MATLAEDISKLTDRYQTTVPARVRQQLKLGKGDHIRYRTDSDGRVYIEAAQEAEAEDDPALAPFLDLLEADMKAHPARLAAVGDGLYARMANLAGEIDVDLDVELSADDE